VKTFNAPRLSLGNLDAEAAARVITAAADIALVLDADGTIRDVALGANDLQLDAGRDWIGSTWSDTVTVESRPKVAAMLAEVAADAGSRWRQLNHPGSSDADVPILYSAVRLGRRGSVLALGRDLRAVSQLQQQMMDTQRTMEREFSRLRHAETRYRLLFQLAGEAVLILEAASMKIAEANPAALRLLGDSTKRLVGRSYPFGLDGDGLRAVQDQLAALRTSGRADDVVARTSDGKQRLVVAASLFRHETASFLLVRLAPLSGDARAAVISPLRSRLLDVVDQLPDGFVVTDVDSQVLTANAAFLDLTQMGSEAQVRGEPLSRWLGRPGVDLEVLLTHLRQHGAVRSFSTVVRGQFGTATEVEISAVAVPLGDPPCLGFALRNAGARPVADPRGRTLPHSVAQLTELIGRVPLKDLVRDTTDVIERMCIEAALELTKDNRASAAEMLGLSRQSLYVKLRRYGLSGAEDEPAAAVVEGS
jgi:transcriptional regulator PpsR